MNEFPEEERFLNEAVLAGILSEFEWPAPYELEDDFSDGILMRLPRCTVVFSEGPQSEVEASFGPDDTGYPANLTLGHALWILVPESARAGKPLTPNLINDDSIHASLPKVENGIRDLCTILLHHLQPCILGDFSWVPTYSTMIEAPPV